MDSESQCDECGGHVTEDNGCESCAKLDRGYGVFNIDGLLEGGFDSELQACVARNRWILQGEEEAFVGKENRSQ